MESTEGDGWTTAIAGRGKEVVGEIGMRAVATKSSLEQRSIWSWVWRPIVDNPRDQTQYTLDDRYNDGKRSSGDGAATSAVILHQSLVNSNYHPAGLQPPLVCNLVLHNIDAHPDHGGAIAES